MLGDPYCTLAELKAYRGIAADEDSKDSELTWALESASREIEDHCERQFNKETTVSQRVFRVTDSSCVTVDDFHTTTGLVISTDDGTGTFGTVWTAADYELLPLNGIMDGVPGWPYNEIEAVRSFTFPLYGRRASLRVTAQWGWAAVPTPVRQTCLLLAARNYKLSESPTGVEGFGEFGVVRVRDMPEVAKKLRRYKRIAVNVG